MNAEKLGLFRVDELLLSYVIFYYRSGALLQEFSANSKEDRIVLLLKKLKNSIYLQRLSNTIRNSYKFAIIKSNGAFLMSDQFISTAALKIKSRFMNVSNRHIGLKETLVLIPVSADYYLVYWSTSENHFMNLIEEEINILDDECVAKVNNTIINNSYNKVVALSQTSLEEALDSYKDMRPIKMFYGGDSGSGGYLHKKEVFFYNIDEKGYELLKHDGFKYKDLGRNSLCACKSGKKFKKCHELIYERIKSAIWGIYNKFNVKIIYNILGAEIVELPIHEWWNKK